MNQHWGLPFIFLVTGTACGDAGDSPGSAALLSWAVTDAPLLEIGVVEGDSMYQFFGANSAVRLEDGGVVVANTGTGDIRAYDSRGRFLFKAGRRGGGPGEFGWLARVYAEGSDSLVAFDQGRNRMSVFDRQGNFGRSFQLEPSIGTEFPLDAWMYLKNWIVGPHDLALRPSLARAMDRMPPPESERGYRFIRVDEVGYLWVREHIAAQEAVQRWTIFNTTGNAVAYVTTPLRFEAFQIGSDFILGRWRDESDVELIRLYGLTRKPTTATRAAAGEPEPARPATLNEDAFLAEFRSTLRNLVIAQERHYAGHGTYADRLIQLGELDWLGEITVDVVAGDSRGWAAVGVHPDFPRICAMAVGSGVPPGWRDGIPMCAEGP